MSVPNIDSILPAGYTTADCHVFVFGETFWDGSWLFPTDKLIWWAINGVAQPLTRMQKEKTDLVVEYNEMNEFVFSEQNIFSDSLSTTPAKGDIVHAIFDWMPVTPGVSTSVHSEWIDEILQFGSRSAWDETQPESIKEPEGYVNPPALPSGRIPNQLKWGTFAFFTIKVFENNSSKALDELDVSNLRDMAGMFHGFTGRVTLNADLSKWDVSNMTNMEVAFSETTFNGDISGWDTSNVEYMDRMFQEASSFNQDLSQWCVSLISSKPGGFDNGSAFAGATVKQPQWGTCPRGEDQVGNDGGIESNDKWYLGELEAKKVYAGTIQLYPHPEVSLFPIEIDGVTYEEEDAHIFVANGDEVQLPIPADDPDNCPAVFVAVDGVEVTPTHVEIEMYPGESHAYWKYYWTVPANENQVIHAIFDWDNKSYAFQDWFSSIQQFGLNSVTGKRNQLNSGYYAFYEMKANPSVIANLDTSNVTDMGQMFMKSSNFNQDISKWDTSNVTDMEAMFESTPFNQDISGWNTSKVTSMKWMFSGTHFNQDISKWDVSNVTNMTGMFQVSLFDSDISGWNTSNVTDMGQMFMRSLFNQDISKWDVSNVEDMSYMFFDSSFNSDISQWDTSNVTEMSGMFWGANSFNQDLSQWCVSKIGSKPWNFDYEADAWTLPNSRPVWGTCPLPVPDGYSVEDCHIFVANGNEVKLPIRSGELPIFVAVNGEDVTPTSFVTRTIELEEIGADEIATTTSKEVEVAAITANDGDIIHAIFDWNNYDGVEQNWFKDILQFGLNSVTGKRNQLKSGENAFRSMKLTLAIIENLDISNLTNIANMFSFSSCNADISKWDTSNVTNMWGVFMSSDFNQDISGWNTSKVDRMSYMFYNATKFSKNLSQWCVSLIGSKPPSFDTGASSWSPYDLPVWGTCPRGENRP